MDLNVCRIFVLILKHCLSVSVSRNDRADMQRCMLSRHFVTHEHHKYTDVMSQKEISDRSFDGRRRWLTTD